MSSLQDNLRALEAFLGMEIMREPLEAGSKKSYNEIFAYALCNRFVGREEQITQAIQETKKCIVLLMGEDQNQQIQRKTALLFSALGNLYYIAGDFHKSLGCFMKSLSNEKNDLIPWVELMFAYRAVGEFDTFEEIHFNLEKYYHAWQKHPSTAFNHSVLQEILGLKN